MSKERVVETPSIEVASSLGDISLTYLNTRMRRFGDSPHVDHVEYRDGEGRLKAFFPEDWLKKMLFKEDYPWLYLPKVALDSASIKFYDDMMYGKAAGL